MNKIFFIVFAIFLISIVEFSFVKGGPVDTVDGEGVEGVDGGGGGKPPSKPDPGCSRLEEGPADTVDEEGVNGGGGGGGNPPSNKPPCKPALQSCNKNCECCADLCILGLCA